MPISEAEIKRIMDGEDLRLPMKFDSAVVLTQMEMEHLRPDELALYRWVTTGDDKEPALRTAQVLRRLAQERMVRGDR